MEDKRTHISSKRTLLFMIMFSNLLRSDATIKWELFTKPAVFGTSIALECKMPQYECCDKHVRRWLGGNDLHLLVMNGISVNNDKYSEVLNETSFSSQLQIYQLDEKDVNVPYECSYGFETYVDVLRSTEEYFVSLPIEPVDENISSTSLNGISFKFILEHVFPRPICSASVNKRDIRDDMNTSSDMQDLFYAAFITITYILVPGIKCPIMLSILCKVGMGMFTLDRTVNCTDVPITETHDGKVYKREMIAALSVVLVLFLIVSSIFIMICRRIQAEDNYPEITV